MDQFYREIKIIPSQNVIDAKKNSVAKEGPKTPVIQILARFQQILRARGYTVFIRQSRGEDISAACGQLAGKIAEK